MADGSRQSGFNFPAKPLVSALRAGEIVVDFFAAGGGVSEALKQALGRDPDIAVNHDPLALGMHAANHPFTRHLPEDVWLVNILREVAGRPVGWFHASPDCTHFSQARGGQPRSRETRSLSWVVVKVAGTLARHGLAPRIISLENVKQILKWGPLIAKRDKATGRVVKLDGTIAAPGERVPLREQFLVPDPRHAGRTWKQFMAALRVLGYVVECRKLIASDYGAGTDRERLFMIARRDGQPIVWPAPTHGYNANQQQPSTAADNIDWSLMGRSIFHRPRPLRPNTIRRLLDGARRGNWPRPYIDALVALRDGRTPDLRISPAQAREIAERFGHKAGMIMAVGGGGVARDVCRPVPAITTGGNGASPHFIRPVIAPYYGSGSGTSGQPDNRPLPTITTKARFGLAEPVIVSTCNSNSPGVRMASQPLRVITTARGGDMALAEPVVTGYCIDILYRMLVERELFNAQGFPRSYIIDRTASGKRITRQAAVRMVGNSVSPPPLAAIARANLDPVQQPRRIAA